MKATYSVGGMTCGGCVRAVGNAIQALAPAAKVTVDLERSLVTVEGAAAESTVARAIEEAGFVYNGRAPD
ncbi:MAG TPA: heavy-metal-associated domain-containing protein [Alphaproteobacteria bacterium]|nr:heavy-metal-associated domain-containing protein [Alphaproteobacteria bacterium]